MVEQMDEFAAEALLRAYRREGQRETTIGRWRDSRNSQALWRGDPRGFCVIRGSGCYGPLLVKELCEAYRRKDQRASWVAERVVGVEGASEDKRASEAHHKACR